MFPFSAIITASGSITFTDRDGTSHTIVRDNICYDEAKEILGKINQLDLFTDQSNDLVDRLVQIANPIKAVNASSGGKVTIREGIVYYNDDGEERVVHNAVAEHLIWMLGEKFDVSPMMLFLERLMLNPSYRSVNDLYRFMQSNKMGITQKGFLLAYKKVRYDFRDIHSGKFDNSPGQRPKMPRNEVEDDPTKTCSEGLHVCGYDYLPSFSSSGRGDDRVVLVEVDPKDVVSVPIDYDDAKMRVSTYRVVKEIEDYGKRNVLSEKSVIDPENLHPSEDEGNMCPQCESTTDGYFCSRCGWEKEPEPDTAYDVNGWASDEVEPLGQWKPMGPPEEVKPFDPRDALESVNAILGDHVGVEMKLDGQGGLDLKMRPLTVPEQTTPITISPVDDKMIKLVQEHLGMDATPENFIGADLGADSIDCVDLIMAIEENFDIEISDENAHRDITVAELIALVEKTRNAKNADRQ
jgi:acyl carrier protein